MKIKFRLCNRVSEDSTQEAGSSEAIVGSPKMDAFDEGVGKLVGNLFKNEEQSSAPVKLNLEEYWGGASSTIIVCL